MTAGQPPEPWLTCIRPQSILYSGTPVLTGRLGSTGHERAGQQLAGGVDSNTDPRAAGRHERAERSCGRQPLASAGCGSRRNAHKDRFADRIYREIAAPKAACVLCFALVATEGAGIPEA